MCFSSFLGKIYNCTPEDCHRHETQSSVNRV